MAMLFILAMLINTTMGNKVVPAKPASPSQAQEAEFGRLLAQALRRSGWRVLRQSKAEEGHSDFVFAHDNRIYLAQIKRSPEGRRDRLVPLLSQAILQAQAFARHYAEPALPVAVVAAPRVPESLAEEIRRFAANYAPDVAVGVMDAEGFRAFWGQGLEVLNSERRSLPPPASSRHAPASRLFSDLNQWMLKVLLSQNIPESLLSAPRGPHRNASQLARAAGVSVMSAYRFIRDMSRELFIEEHRNGFRVVRIEALLQRWAAANQGAMREYPARWILSSGKDQLSAAVRGYMSQPSHAAKRKPHRQESVPPRQRICLGLFAAAEALGMGFVHGVPPHIYVDEINDDLLQKLGLSLLEAENRPDAYIRIPEYGESVFRGAVQREGLAISDILQVWLDVSNFPARGQAQAYEIRKKVIKPLLQGERRRIRQRTSRVLRA
jgi:hypothetical protein